MPVLRLKDHLGTPEPSYHMAKTIRSQIGRAVAGWKMKKQFAYRNKYRLQKAVGLDHSADPEEMGRGAKVGSAAYTPLTKMQHLASLPRHTEDDSRFASEVPRHTLHYTVKWGPPRTEKDPTGYQCVVTFRLSECNLTSEQQQRVLDIVGRERYDRETGIVALESDLFADRNQNAAFLGDALEVLMRKAVAT
uniref:Small ribosomal subunit protein mS35 mitochondrial conserved domain-containing protein n=1 Tax=Chromera velia CCMP2878 TaxID=1169474 RepID=A0A0G4I690_9ALVE|eukprot:Cvel_11304.t1-p1 / transcript=Cvel_11304.t1 / gene=Cvel_11304 / organism=Chromera_velia_CCMP2878 / gene_product=hypothetical protein / transcript_product=hypothetical protein / location=Cvel_scaffold706:60792-62063(-) / protein_length=191 / sequence_SO=supercontig / SO=protein_coding / is_pseudo=false